MLTTCQFAAAALLCTFWARATAQPPHCLLSVAQSRSKVLGLLPEVLLQDDTDGDYIISRLDNETESLTSSGLELQMAARGVEQVLCPLSKSAVRSELSILSRLHRDHHVTGTPRQCAVVSNSGVLLNHKHGAEIDAADLVIRYNDAAIGGDLQEYVGAKDDIRILNGKFNQDLFADKPPMELNNRTLYVLLKVYPGAADGKQMYTEIEQHLAERPSLHVYVDTLNLFEWMAKQAISHTFAGHIPVSKLTTGTMGGFMALSLCDEVRAYGFAETAESASAPFHYFGDLQWGSADVNSVHISASAEKLLWRTMATNDDVDSTAVAVVPGFRHLTCDNIPDGGE